MSLNIKNFVTLVQDQAAAIQARASALIDFSVGSVLRAIVEANAAVALWLESLAVYILALTRAATSQGADLDSWMADFGLTRLGAAAAGGQVTFSRYSTTVAGLVPVGSQVQTTDKTQTFTVIADATNSAYNATLGGYTLAPGVVSVAVPVRAVNAGSAGNVAAGTVTVIYGAVTGIDYATNAGGFSGGSDAESDGALRVRFVLWIAGLAAGTKAAVGSAIANLQLGIQWTITENLTLGGVAAPGFFFVVVDDGTGSPPSSLITAVQAAVESVRPLGIAYAVYSPTVVSVSVSMAVTVASGYDATTVKGQVGAAIEQFIDTLALGAPLHLTRLSQVAYDASPGVANVSAILINGGTSDVVPTSAQVVKYSTVSVA